jgi:hypothetical protein
VRFGRGDRDRPSPGDPIGGWCEHCGAAYAVGAELCPECHAGVPHTSAPPTFSVPELTDDFTDDERRHPESPVAIRDDQRHDIVEYALADWTWPKAKELSTELERSRIAYEWDGTTLRVPGAHETEVDELIDILDGANDADLEDNIVDEPS